MRLVGSEEMRAIDRMAVEEFGVPSLSLMERAGWALADAALSMASPSGRFAVVCGSGNNGGDGWVAARLLRAAGREVVAYAVQAPEKLQGDAKETHRQAQDAGVVISGIDALGGFVARPGDVAVDAVLGTGLTRPTSGVQADAIDQIRRLREEGARVVSADLPSGLNSEHGMPMGNTVQADRTVTFGFAKLGLFLHPGKELAGEVVVADIGIPAAAAARLPASAQLMQESAARAIVPLRPVDAHKGDAGRVLVIAGATGKTGAAHLALSGALRGGAGLVSLAARPEVLPLALAGRPEAMSIPLPGNGPLGRSDLQALLAATVGAHALVIGPGIPRGPETGPLLQDLLARTHVPVVLDADALNAIADHPGLVATIARGGPLVLTPHPGEMARLLGSTIEEVQEDRVGLARRKALEWGVVLVLKGAATVVADPEGPAAVIPTGNPGMATGGTGDVLAGLIGALLAGRLAARDAARAGAWIHGRAGDLARERYGERGLLAGDLADALGQVWREWGR
jgi:NAD(P)H-hydrate epimerase